MEEQIKQLATYLKDQMSKGVSEDVLKGVSLGQGWSETDFTKALAVAKGLDLPPTPISNSTASLPTQSGPIAQNSNGFSFDSLTKNEKFMTTVKTTVIYTTVVYLVLSVVGKIVSNIFYKYSLFRGLGMNTIVSSVVTGLIGGIFVGIVFYFFYDKIKAFIKTIPVVKIFIKDMFSAIWIPILVGQLISIIFVFLPFLTAMMRFSGGMFFRYSSLSLSSVMMVGLANSVLNLIVYFYYAKKVSEKLSHFYPW